MKIEQIKIKDLVEYKLNSKIHPETQIDGLAASIQKFGFIQSLVVSKKNEIIIGHGRFLAAKKLGMEQLPCVRLENLTKDEIKALRLIDNRIAETSWDSEFLKNDLASIDFSFDSFNIDFDFLNVNLAMPEKQKDGAKELDEKEFNSFDSVCPRCNFEFNRK
jgi:ParB family chromosome partitioning protein